VINYNKIELVICDSGDAIKYAWRKGLSNKVPILTQSPSLSLNKNFNTINYSSFNKKGFFCDAGKYTNELAYKIEKKLKKNADYSIYRALIHAALVYPGDGPNVTNIIAKLMFLSKSHIEKKNILIIKLKSEDKIEERRLNFPWEDLFDLKIKFDVLEFNLENKKRTNLLENNLFVKFNLSRFNVLSLKKFRNIFYKCSLFFFDKFSFSNKEHFGLFIDNYTMREAAVNLVLKGYGITKLEDPKKLELNNENVLKFEKKINKIIKQIDLVLYDFLKKEIPKIFIKGLKEIIIKKIKFFLIQNKISIEYWERVFHKKNRKIIGILSNITVHPASRSLYSYCLIKNIPFFIFQHGAGLELTKVNETRYYLCESTFSDIFFVYNKIWKKFNLKNKFKVSKIVNVGVPREYQECKKVSFFRNSDFLYVSTLIYAGNIKFAENDTDNEMANFEINLIKKVLSKNKNNFMYKYYPQINLYTDKDPVLDELKKYKNIKLYKKNLNLMQMCSKYKVIITSRGTSTLFWCLWLDKPIIFIDLPNSKPLRKETKKALESYLFYFNYSDKDFYIKLNKFLSKGTEQILSLFKKEKLKNKHIVEKYFQYYKKGAGEKTAEHIIGYINENKQIKNQESMKVV